MRISARAGLLRTVLQRASYPFPVSVELIYVNQMRIAAVPSRGNIDATSTPEPVADTTGMERTGNDTAWTRSTPVFVEIPRSVNGSGGWRRVSGSARHELQCGGIDAVAQAGRLRAVIEHMPQMRIAHIADDFGTYHVI